MSYDALSLFQNLKEGSKIDVQDQEGDWFETIVRKVIGNKIICHFWGFANIWDCTIEFHPNKIAPVHSYSEKSKYRDNEKVLGECVWEILSLKNMLNTNKQCTNQSYNIIQNETGISKQNMQSFLDTMDAPDNIQLKLCKWVQKNVIEMGLHLRIQELMENGADCFGYNKDIENNIKTIENMDNIKAKISESINKIKQNKNKIQPIIPSNPQTINTQTAVVIASHSHSHSQEIKPLNLANLSKIDLPEIPDIPLTKHSIDSSTTNTDNNSSDSHSYSHNHTTQNMNIQTVNTNSIIEFNMIQQNGKHLSIQNDNTQSDINNKSNNTRKRKQSVPSKKPKKRHKKNSETAAMITSMIDQSHNGHNKVLVTKYDANSPRKEWLDIPSKDELEPGLDGKYRCKSLECLDKPAFKTYTSTCRHIQIEHQGYRYRCDLCRDEYKTEVEFRSHSTLKIHLANMHKLNKNDFSKIRIILSLTGQDSIVKKTASCDEYQFKKWKKKIINSDKKRNKLKKSKSDPNPLSFNGINGITFNGKHNINKKHILDLQALDLGLNLDLGCPATKPPPAPPVPKIPEKDKEFMNKIDQIITGVNDTNNGKNIKIKIKTQTVSPKPKPKPKATHKKDRKPICPICGQKFKNFQALGGHKKKHNPNWGRNRKIKQNDINHNIQQENTNNKCDDDFDIQMDEINKKLKPKTRLIRSHSAEMPTHSHSHSHSHKSKKSKKHKSKLSGKVVNGDGLDINFSTMPQIQIQMPPPPPPKLESDSDISDGNNDNNNNNNNMKHMHSNDSKYESIYVREERDDKLYFKY
eukprot:245772_1